MTPDADNGEGRPTVGVPVARRNRALGLFVSALLVGSAAVTLVAGVPDRLPTVALASAVLLHAERAAALFLLGLGALALVRAAFAGQLPSELSPQGVKFAQAGIEGVESRVATLERDAERDQREQRANRRALRTTEREIEAERRRLDAMIAALDQAGPRQRAGGDAVNRRRTIGSASKERSVAEDCNEQMARLNEESKLAAAEAREAFAALEDHQPSEFDEAELAAARRQTRDAIEGLRALSERAERRRRSPLARLLGV